MKHTITRDLECPPAAVIASLHDLDHIDSWINGLLDHKAEPRPDGTTDLVFKIRAPRTLSLRLEVVRKPDGLTYALVEGDPTTAQGQIIVTATDSGSRVGWTHELAFQVAVPRLLLRELDEEVIPRWITAWGTPRKPVRRSWNQRSVQD